MTKPCVLIVDDEFSIRDSLKTCLKEKFLVVTAGCIAEAERALGAVHVDLVLSDYHIGEETLPELAKIIPAGIKLVGMSGAPRWACLLPTALEEIPWIEKGAWKFEEIRLTVMEALINGTQA